MASLGPRVAEIEEMERVKGGSDFCGGILLVVEVVWWQCSSGGRVSSKQVEASDLVQ